MIVLAYDHRSFKLMIKIKKYLDSLGLRYVEFASPEYTKTDSYSEFAKLGVQEILKDSGNLGIFSCRTGIGICMAANRTKGIRAGLCHTNQQVFLARNDDNMNVLCVPCNICMFKLKRMINTFIGTPFEGGRHQARVDKMDE